MPMVAKPYGEDDPMEPAGGLLRKGDIEEISKALGERGEQRWILA